MLYQDMLDDETATMEEQLYEPSKTLQPHEILVPLKSLMQAPLTVETGASVQAAVDLMAKEKTGYVLVASDRVLKGIFGERDILLKILNKERGDLEKITVDEFMSENPQSLHVEDSLDSAIVEMAEGGYRHIPIVDDHNHPIGVVSIGDIISYLVGHFPQEILTLPPRPVRNAMTAREGA